MSKWKQWRKRGLFFLMLLVLLVTLGGFVAPWVPVGMLPELQLLATILPFLFPVWLFFLWRTIRLSAWKQVPFVLTGLLITGWVASRDLRSDNRQQLPEGALKVLSFNVGTFDFDENNILEVGDLVKDLQPDVVVMQEFRNQDAGNGQKAMEFLAELWDMPNHDFLHLPYHVHGAAFFSRFPISEVDTLFLPREEINSGILITVETDEGPVGIGNVHFSSFHIRAIYEKEADMQRRIGGIHARARETLVLQQEKADKVIAKLGEYPHPVILAGDFNATPHSRIVRQISDRYQDSFLAAGYGRGWSFKVLGPLGIRIDYQFASSNLQPLSHQVIRQDISDHYPLMVAYQLTR